MNTCERAVEEAAYRLLRQSGYAELKRILCQYECRTRVLTLRGTVSSYYMKQIAQSRLHALEDVGQIVNAVDVEQE